MTNIYRDVKLKIKELTETNESRTPGTGKTLMEILFDELAMIFI